MLPMLPREPLPMPPRLVTQAIDTFLNTYIGVRAGVRVRVRVMT